jgi:hypothetical protein
MLVQTLAFSSRCTPSRFSNPAFVTKCFAQATQLPLPLVERQERFTVPATSLLAWYAEQQALLPRVGIEVIQTQDGPTTEDLQVFLMKTCC